jgi:hypothetical protein
MSGEIVPPLPCKIDNRVSKAQKTKVDGSRIWTTKTPVTEEKTLRN